MQVRRGATRGRAKSDVACSVFFGFSPLGSVNGYFLCVCLLRLYVLLSVSDQVYLVLCQVYCSEGVGLDSSLRTLAPFLLSPIP